MWPLWSKYIYNSVVGVCRYLFKIKDDHRQIDHHLFYMLLQIYACVCVCVSGFLYSKTKQCLSHRRWCGLSFKEAAKDTQNDDWNFMRRTFIRFVCLSLQSLLPSTTNLDFYVRFISWMYFVRTCTIFPKPVLMTGWRDKYVGGSRWWLYAFVLNSQTRHTTNPNIQKGFYWRDDRMAIEIIFSKNGISVDWK